MTTTSQQLGPLYLCLDQGGSRSRALLYDQQGQLLDRVEQPVASQQPAPDRVEQQPQELVSSLESCASQLIARLPTHQKQRLARWGLSCQRSSLICVEPNTLAPLTPVISWRDCRGASQPLWDDRQQRWLRQRTGLRPSHHHGASKLCWLMKHDPAVIQAAESNNLLVLPLASYLAARLAHRKPTADPCNAQRTLLFNPHELEWDPALLAQFDIPSGILPPLQPCRADWGELRLAGTSLQGGYVGGDQGCALFADGRPTATELKVNLGSGGFICLAIGTEQAQQLPHSLLLSLATSSAEQQQWMAEGTINGAGTALQWWADYERRRGNVLVEAEFFQRPLNSHQGVFINTVSGVGSPYWRAGPESYFVDAQTPDERYCALVESILFLIRVQLECLTARQLSIHRLRLSGGLSRINGLGQRLADLCQLPVLQSVQHEASGRGLAYLLADQPEGWPEAPSHPYKPQQDPPLQRRYQRWKTLLERHIRSD